MKSKLLQKKADWVPEETVQTADTLVEHGLGFLVRRVYRESDEIVVTGSGTVRRYFPERLVSVWRKTAAPEKQPSELPAAPADFPEYVSEVVDNVDTNSLYSVLLLLTNGHKPEPGYISNIEQRMRDIQRTNPQRAAYIYYQLKNMQVPSKPQESNFKHEKAASTKKVVNHEHLWAEPPAWSEEF